MADPNKEHYRDNLTLKRPNIQIEFTKDQIEEYTKCSKDPVYFIKNYIKIISLDHGLVNLELYPFQEKMVRSFHENRFTICKIGRQSGKCAESNTEIKIRNKTTGEEKEISIGDFFEKIKNNT